MRQSLLCLFISLAVLIASTPIAPAGEIDEYLRVEARGTLSVELDPKTKQLRQAELHFKKPLKNGLIGRMHLILATDQEMHDLAKKSNGQTVLVTGRLGLFDVDLKGVQPPPRYVIYVDTLRLVKRIKK